MIKFINPRFRLPSSIVITNESRHFSSYSILCLVMDSYVKRLDNLNHRLESVTNHLQTSGVNQKSSSNENVDNLPILRDYNTILNGSLSSFVNLSRKIGGELVPMMDHVMRLFNRQKEFLQQSIQKKKPANDQKISELIKPQSNEIEAIVGK